MGSTQGGKPEHDTPGKQGRSLQVVTALHMTPSPAYPNGHGPHLGPEENSVH